MNVLKPNAVEEMDNVNFQPKCNTPVALTMTKQYFVNFQNIFANLLLIRPAIAYNIFISLLYVKS